MCGSIGYGSMKVSEVARVLRLYFGHGAPPAVRARRKLAERALDCKQLAGVLVPHPKHLRSHMLTSHVRLASLLTKSKHGTRALTPLLYSKSSAGGTSLMLERPMSCSNSK